MDSAEFRRNLDRDPAFTGKRALDFAMLVSSQADAVYKERGMTFPVIVSSALLYLTEVGPASLLDISRALGHPHQLVAQRVKTLQKLDFITSEPDPNDRRRTVFHLTDTGRAQGARLLAYRAEAAEVFSALSHEVGAGMLDLLHRAIAALEAKPLTDRFPATLKQG